MPKIVDKQAKRKEIAKTAMNLFAQKGFDSTSIREITSCVGMGKGSFYDYFKDKEDLLNETVHVLFSEWSTVLALKIKDVEDPLMQLQLLLQEGAKLGDELEQLMIVYIDIWRRSVSQKDNSEYSKTLQNFLMDYKKAIATIVDAAKAQGKIRKNADSSAIATTLLALVDGLCLHRMILKDKLDINSVSSDIFTILLNGMK
jgi:AcrR family transcriptional regulator